MLPNSDFRFGGPVWWNTPLDDEDAGKLEENRTTWGQGAPGEQGEDMGAGPDGGPGPGPSGGSRKRPASEFDGDGDDEMPAEVRARLEALKKGSKALD